MINLDKGIWTKENLAYTRRILRKLSDDPYLPEIFGYIDDRVANIWVVLAYLAKTLKPYRYAELGVRRGFSMACVAGRVKDATLVGFDSWISRYGGADNPGPDFVCHELAKVGYKGTVSFVNGDCGETVPAYDGAPFPLILADAGHAEPEVYRDIHNCLRLLDVGGYLVIDDLQDTSVMIAWQRVTAERNFWTWQKGRVGVICNG